MILSPASTRSQLIAQVSHKDTWVLAMLPEIDETFRKVVKGFGCEWNGARRTWQRSIGPLAGDVAHRAAELAGRLLAAGYAVNVDDALAAMIQAGSWQPEHKRWVITVGGLFGLRWRGQDDNLYTRARMLPESEWDHEALSVTVPALYFQEVAGFAEQHDFRFSDKAEALRTQAERDYARTLLPVIPAPIARPEPKAKARRCDPARFADLPERRLVTTTNLYPHQAQAVEKLLPLRLGALFMDMGTGKTRCAIEMAARRQARTSKVVWFCPVSLKLTIAAEIAKHAAGEPVHVFDDATSDNNIPPAYWYIVGIESMSSSDRVVLAVNALVDADSFVIVDESSYIKGHASKRSMRIAEVSKRARYRLLLTGTPISQGVEDLYAQMRFLDPAILGYNSFYTFAANHLEYSDKYPGMVRRALNVGHLAEKIEPYTYQVQKSECLDLPAKLYDQVYFDLTREQREAYEQAKHEILLDVLDDDLPDWVIFKLFTALQQVVSGFWHRAPGEMIELPHRRLDVMQTVISSIPDDCKVIIWCKYVRSLEQIAQALPGAACYYGGLNERERAAQLERFRGDGCRFLAATASSGGHGLTLNEAHYAIFYENEFKYANRAQAEDRCHRIGQALPVTYLDIVSRSGIDERIQAALSKKQDVVKMFRREVQKKKGTVNQL